MRNLNKVMVIGRLGKDVESRFMPNGNQVVSFSIACSDDYKTQAGEKVEKTEWIPCVAYGKLAEIAGLYLKKGSKVFIEGKFTTQKWEKDGVTHYSTSINLSNMQMLDSKPQVNNQQSPGIPTTQTRYNKPTTDNFDGFEDDIPFMSLNLLIKKHIYD